MNASSGEFQRNSVELLQGSCTPHIFTDSFTDSGLSDIGKLLIYNDLKMEPMVGIEPTTYGLRNRCSTTELHWLPGSE